jgi:hypothetical protein
MAPIEQYRMDYYRLRSCSSDQATCVANFEGFIDAQYCGPADPHCLKSASTIVSRRCAQQSQDRDTARPLPYKGAARRLFDASQCHIGAGSDTGFGVTTFFANYGSSGSCWAAAPTDPACQYVKAGAAKTTTTAKIDVFVPATRITAAARPDRAPLVARLIADAGFPAGAICLPASR